MDNVMKKFNVFSEWVMHLFMLQVLWLGGTLFGGVILGIFPATVAVFSTIQKLKRREAEFSVFSYYVQAYKKNFKESLFIGGITLIIGLIGAVYVYFLNTTTNSWLAYTHFFMYLMLLLMGLFLFYLIPVYIHYEVKMTDLVKTTFFIMLSSMKWNLPLLLTLLAAFLIFLRFSVVILFFGASLPMFITFHFCMKAFDDFDVKREKYDRYR